MSWIRISDSPTHNADETVEPGETIDGGTVYIITPTVPDDSNAEIVVPEVLPPAQGQE